MFTHKFWIIISLLFSLTSVSAQIINKSDSLQTQTTQSLDLELKYTPLHLSINTAELNKSNRVLYLYSQHGMYEQFNINPSETVVLRPYKAHYPSGVINVGHFSNRQRDSFNPHGSDDIGSALINGFLNGVLLGNKY